MSKGKRENSKNQRRVSNKKRKNRSRNIIAFDQRVGELVEFFISKVIKIDGTVI